MFGAFLYPICDTEIVASYRICLLKSDGAIYKTQEGKNQSFGLQKDGSFKGNGTFNFVRQGKIFDEWNDILKNDVLSFLVTCQTRCTQPQTTLFANKNTCTQPQTSFADNIFNNMFNDEGMADVAFEVKGIVLYAHRAILRACAPELFELIEEFDIENKMPINDVEPYTFGIMLEYVYGKRILADDWKDHSKSILDASGKYGLSALRLEAEAWHVKNLDLSVDGAIDELLYADGNHCLLLKKAVIDFIVENGQAVIASSSFLSKCYKCQMTHVITRVRQKTN